MAGENTADNPQYNHGRERITPEICRELYLLLRQAVIEADNGAKEPEPNPSSEVKRKVTRLVEVFLDKTKPDKKDQLLARATNSDINTSSNAHKYEDQALAQVLGDLSYAQLSQAKQRYLIMVKRYILPIQFLHLKALEWLVLAGAVEPDPLKEMSDYRDLAEDINLLAKVIGAVCYKAGDLPNKTCFLTNKDGELGGSGSAVEVLYQAGCELNLFNLAQPA